MRVHMKIDNYQKRIDPSTLHVRPLLSGQVQIKTEGLTITLDGDDMAKILQAYNHGLLPSQSK